MKFILGKKIEMTQIFTREGEVIPVTIVKAGPCKVTQIRTKEKDNYRAVQIGFDKAKKLKKPQAGHLKELENFKYLAEFRDKYKELPSRLERGDLITVEIFKPGDKVQVSGVSKGKGFQGVVKRHGFKGSPASHGHKDQLRMPGSIGASGVGRVFPGTRMPGRMGARQVTVKNLEIVEVKPEKNLLYIKGAVPGGRNTLLKISGPGEMALKKGEEGEEKAEGGKRAEKGQKEDGK